MNENSPKTLSRLTSFINRDQYGYRPPFPRRAVNDEGQKAGPTWTNYKSDWDFFWTYQTDHMYHRYLEWNFIGRDTDRQDAGVDWSKTLGIPFFLGLFGCYWHFKRDKKRALTLLAAFIMLGWMTDWYQNQQDPQPRERDYFYVGAFYVYAMWIGIGATGVMEILRAKKKDTADGEERKGIAISTGEGNTAMLGGVFLAAMILVPLNQCVGLAGLAMGKSFNESSKWAEYSRQGNYIPYDYGYNILQSCEKDAILFTFGDNDTFPLWCLQDVYSIRRDVRIVQLSLSNIGWYIDQLKNQSPWGAKKIALTAFSDAALQQAQDSPLAPHYDQGTSKAQSVAISAEAVRYITGDQNRGGSTLNWNQTGTFGDGKNYIFTVSDQLIVDILKNNINDRPIYFSTSVPDNYRSGLDPYLVSEGMALRVTPDQHPDYRSDYGGPIFEDRLKEYLYNPPAVPFQDAHKGMLIRTYNDTKAHHSFLDGAYSQSYYLCFLKLISFEIQKGNKPEALRALDTMDHRLPPEIVNSEDILFSMIAEDYYQCGDTVKAKRYANVTLKYLDILDKYTPGGSETEERRHLYYQLSRASLDVILGRYDEAIPIYHDLEKMTNDKSFAIKAGEAEALKLEHAGNRAGAAAKYDEVVKMFKVPDSTIPQEYKYLIKKRDELK
jgi:hypothetical protein